MIISIFPALSMPNAILLSPHSLQSSLEIWVIYAIPKALASIFICSSGRTPPKLFFKKLKIGLISIITKEKMMMTADSLDGNKNSFLAFFIKTHKIALAIPMAHIFTLSIKVQTHPLFHQINFPSHR